VTQARIASALLQSLSSGADQGNQYGFQASHGYGRGANAFVGRFSDPVLDMRVDGHKPDGQEVNILVVDLPVPSNARATLREKTDPFVSAPILELEDETPPGTRKMGGVFR
jgi:hypothetical protein